MKTNTERAYEALHEARTNDWISQEDYEAEIHKLNDQDAVDDGSHIDVVIALLIALALLYVGWRYLAVLP